MSLKERLHELVDLLPDNAIPEAERRLEELASDGLVSWDDAPYDDEPETEEERLAVAEAKADLAAGRVVPHEEARRLWLDES